MPLIAQDELDIRWAEARQLGIMSESAGIALREVIRMADARQCDSISAKARYLLGKYYFLHLQDTSARRLFAEARQLFIGQGDWERAGFTYVQAGLSYIQDNRLDSALMAFHRSIEIYRTHGLQKHLWTPYIGLSNIHEKAGDMPAAFREARQAVAALGEGADRAGQVITFNHIVRLARAHDSLQVYAAYADQLLRIYSPLEINANVPQHAEHFIHEADRGQREAVIRKFIRQLEAFPPTLELVSAHYQLGRTFAEAGRTEAAIDAYTEAYGLEQRITREPHFSPLLLRALGDQYALAGRYAEAFSVLKRYEALKDSLLQVHNHARIAELQLQYEAQGKDLEIERQRAALDRRTMERNSILALAALLLAGGGFALFSQRRHVRDQATINRQREALHVQEIADLRKAHAIDQLHTLVSAQEEERRRIALDLHDSLGGLLASLKIHFHAMVPTRMIPARQAVSEHLRLIDTVSAETRRIAHNMMPTALRRMGLGPAIDDMVRLIENDKGLDVTFQNIDFHERIAPEKEIGLYRIAQELCNNVMRHAGARHLLIQLSRHNGSAALVVEDDGRGFDLGAVPTGLGLESIRSRVAFLKGELDIVSTPGEGTSVTVQIPLS